MNIPVRPAEGQNQPSRKKHRDDWSHQWDDWRFFSLPFRDKTVLQNKSASNTIYFKLNIILLEINSTLNK